MLASGGLSVAQLLDCPSDRHRGGGHPPSPAKPPSVRVRTRRFELVALALIDQRRKAERCEVSIGKPNGEGLGPSEVQGAASAASRVASKARTNSPAPAGRRGDDVVSSIVATEQLAIGPNGLGTPAPLAFRRNRRSCAAAFGTDLQNCG